jgi:hypothetical protein
VMIFSHYEVQKLYPEYFDNKKILTLLLASLPIIIVNFALFMDLSLTNSIIKFLICCLFPILLFIFKFFDRTEIQKLKEISHKFFSHSSVNR